jgi:ATP-dependent protease ClpP protease subunit
MFVKAAQAADAVEIASPGGSFLISMMVAQMFKQKSIPVRVTGWCASGCAMIAIGSGNCTVARSGRLVLHAPSVPPGLSATETARALETMRNQWRDWMHTAGVPSDLTESTIQSFRQQLELSEYGMKRVGCRLE